MIKTMMVSMALLAAGIAPAAAQETPRIPIESEFADGKAWILVDPMEWRIGESNVSIVVPEGFVHDKASIPPAMWVFLPKSGRYTRAAVIHDYLYWTQRCTREQADNLLVIAMKESNVGWFRRRSVYRGVRLGGANAWVSNHGERIRGLPRINPDVPLPANITWPELRQQLVARPYRDPPIDPRNDYCAYGNSQDVPRS